MGPSLLAEPGIQDLLGSLRSLSNELHMTYQLLGNKGQAYPNAPLQGGRLLER